MIVEEASAGAWDLVGPGTGPKPTGSDNDGEGKPGEDGSGIDIILFDIVDGATGSEGRGIVGLAEEGGNQANFVGMDSFIYTCVDDGTTTAPRAHSQSGGSDPIADMLTRHENVSEQSGEGNLGGGDITLVDIVGSSSSDIDLLLT